MNVIEAELFLANLIVEASSRPNSKLNKEQNDRIKKAAQLHFDYTVELALRFPKEST